MLNGKKIVLGVTGGIAAYKAASLASLLCKEYEVDAETALADAEKMVKSWQECGVLE